MGKNEQSIDGYVKKETMLLAALGTLVLGFIIGVVFGIYKSGTGPAVPMQQPHEHEATESENGGRLEAQRIALEKETEKDPKNVEAWIKLGHFYFDSNQFEKAIQVYEKALAIRPDNANVLTDLGVMYRRNGNPKKAVEMFDQAISVDSKHEIARFNKGIVLMHDLEDTAAAVDAWEDLLSINPAAVTPNGQSIRAIVDRVSAKSEKTDQ